MPTGTIKKHFGNKGYGFIVPDDGGSDLFFHAKDKGNESFNQLREKDRVAFDVARSEKGLAAVFVKPIVATHAANSYAMQDEPKETSHEETNAYRFLNPYNFVRFLTPVGVTKGASKATSPIEEKLLALGLKGEAQQDVSATALQLLGKCAPPPHDRYVGLSGKITCTLKTETPLFISDAEGIFTKALDDGSEHKTYRFFQHEEVEHRYLLPASSLRGMIRNVFEAATNSCFIHLHNAQLDYRLQAKAAPELRAGVITRLPNPSQKQDGEICLLQFAWVNSSVIEKAMNGVLAPYLKAKPWDDREFVGNYFKHVLRDHKLPIKAIVAKNQFHKKIKHDKALEILSVGTAGTKLQQPSGDEYWGYLKITGPNVLMQDKQGRYKLRKHDERFFYWDGSTQQRIRIPYQDVAKRLNSHERYDAVRAAQLDEANQQMPYLTCLQNENLTIGDLVWVEVKKDDAGNNVASEIGAVSIPKLRYKYGIADLVTEPLVQGCEQSTNLCPACRAFGWVHRPTENEPQKRDKEVAYAGRLRFSHGQLQHPAKTINREIPLAILSSPKPTTTSFYLLNQNGKPSFGVDYNTEGAKLRGRKFYRHHGSKPNPQEYTRPNGKDDQPIRDGQNRTVRKVLDSDNHFTFRIDFTNLAPVELGALLWSLEMKYQDADGQEQQLFHRLGFAKPLGFGSVKIEVDQVELLQPEKRYQSLQQDGKRLVTRAEWGQQCLAPFKAAMLPRYGRNAGSFEALENVQDLIALLSEPKQCNHIHFPRPPYEDAPDKNIIKPNPEGKQFEWFVGNKKRNAKKFNFKSFTLPLAQEDVQGFELIDKDGNVYSGN